jgi:hypothetical protein
MTGSGKRSATRGTNAKDSTLAVRDTARGSENRTIAGAIKGLFRTATKAVTGRVDDEPPVTRRRKGETEGEFQVMARRIARRFDPQRAFRGAIRRIGHRRGIQVPPEIAGEGAAFTSLSNPLSVMDPFGDGMGSDNDFSESIDATQEYISLEL